MCRCASIDAMLEPKGTPTAHTHGNGLSLVASDEREMAIIVVIIIIIIIVGAIIVTGRWDIALHGAVEELVWKVKPNSTKRTIACFCTSGHHHHRLPFYPLSSQTFLSICPTYKHCSRLVSFCLLVMDAALNRTWSLDPF